MKPLVHFRAPLLTMSGYAIHARQVAEYLLDQEKIGKIDVVFEPLQWGNTTWIVDAKRSLLIEEIMQHCKPLPRKADYSIQLQLPNEWDPNLATKANIGVTAAIETTKANPQWVSCCEKMTSVIVPSKHARQSLVNAGCNSSIQIIPESFDDCFLQDSNLNTDILDPLPPFTFLVFGQMTGMSNPQVDRKNLHNTIAWLLAEFAGDSDVGILLKTNNGRHTVIDLYQTEAIISQVKKSVASQVKKPLPEIHLVHGDLMDSDVNLLYRHPNVKALVSATRGEGFGLPLLEAAACDLPVIATNWSAHTEFLSLGKYIDLPSTLKRIPIERVDPNLFMADSMWAEVSESDFRRRLRKFKNSPTIPRDWAKDLGKKIRIKYNKHEVAKIWSNVLDLEKL